MSHGGAKSGIVHENLEIVKGNSNRRDEFAQAIAKIAVAQICESEGFQSFQQSALEILSDVTVRFIRKVGETTQFHFNLASRTQGNVYDIIQGLEELGIAQGFSGASDISHCLASSGTIREIRQYLGAAEIIPFAYSLQHFPIFREVKQASSFMQLQKEPPREHIPAWLPAFPDPNTYVQTTAVGTVASTSKEEECTVLEKQHKTTNTSEGLRPGIHGCHIEQNREAKQNPFLIAPLQFGEKQVSIVTPPPPKHLSQHAMRNPSGQSFGIAGLVSAMETFAPAIEAMKIRVHDNETQNAGSSNKRKMVNFRICAGKKKDLGEALNMSYQSQDDEQLGLSLGSENEKDAMKRRAKKILKQSMENQGESVQF